MGLLDNIKKDAKKSGQSKGKFIYFREGQKTRVRFLCDMDEGLEITFHDSYEQGINVPCQEHFGKDCPYCGDDSLRTRSQYAWSVWNYETNEVQVFMFPVNNCSPIPALVALYETYGTLTDRDYVISVSGKQQNKSFSVVPMDKAKFRNQKAKPFSEQALLKMIDKAWPAENSGDDDDDDDEAPRKNKAPKKTGGKTKTKKNYDDDEDEDDDYSDEDFDGDEDDDNENEYEDMSPKELFNLCKKRKLDAAPKKSAKYYVNILKEADEAEADWDDDEDGEDDEWEDDDE
ncbi:MAG: hypothetical protein K6F77_08130 [Lachnospiraceae bacterium]|nr:hypothetical protein [Lachnospiraceae bacterium]